MGIEWYSESKGGLRSLLGTISISFHIPPMVILLIVFGLGVYVVWRLCQKSMQMHASRMRYGDENLWFDTEVQRTNRYRPVYGSIR